MSSHFNGVVTKPRDHLGPDDALPIRQPKIGKTWDPTLGAFRAQSLPLALSKSSMSATSSDGRPTTPISQRSSMSLYASLDSSIKSGPSSHSYSPAPKSSASIISSHSKYSSQRTSRTSRCLASSKSVFQNLPPEVGDCILRQLRIVHEDPRLQSCQTCYLRDLCSLSLTSRAWDKVVVKRLYDRIHIVGNDSKEHIKKYKLKSGVRLRLLRRTLRGRTFLAQLVRELKVPRLHEDGYPVPEDMINLVASIVMACPNLERLTGFYPIYGHEFDRLTYALSTKRQLKEHLWLIGENAAITQRSHRQLAPGLMDPEQKGLFVQYHNVWSSLTTLFLHSPHQGILEKDIFVNVKNDRDPNRIRGPGILHRLPALKHLCISNFDMDDFDDFTLQHLPLLHSLRLQDLEGITFWGLSEFSRTKNAFAIRHLSLVNLDITYISAISNMLLHFKNLTRFTLVQDTSPEVAEGEIVFQPIIASHCLEYLHWDIVVPGSANDNLISSIRAKGFPRLRTIRAPSDHYGMIQALCKPRAQVELSSDWSGKAIAKGIPEGGLRAARRAAQQRLEDAWSTVQFKVVVEEDGVVHEIYDLNGFMGTIGSRINYSLEPDIPGSDNALIDFADVVSANGEVATGDTCRGSWNASRQAGPQRWQHTERPRYKHIELQEFF